MREEAAGEDAALEREAVKLKQQQRFLPAFIVIMIMAVLIASYVMAAYAMVKPDEDRICNGVYADEIDLSGMTAQEAQNVLNAHIAKLSQRTLTVDINGKLVSTPLAELGYACESGPVIEKALKIGKEGSLFENYARIKKVAAEHVVYTLTENYSDEKLQEFVRKKCAKKCTKMKNSSIRMKNGKLEYTKSRQGEVLDVRATTQVIQEALREQEDAAEVKAAAVINVQEPKVSKKLASRCKDELGRFSTNFNAGNVSRSKNVANAARLINGSVINPGETFSVHDVISPMTEKNGYYAAPSYSNGEVVDSIGGGVCQVSTTLYNAVLRSELEIVERSPHSMVVTYVKPSMDAAIAGDYKDLKFRNNTEVPIYIEGGTFSGTVFFHVYGEETRDPGRKVEYVSETLETMQPGEDKITYDKTKPASFMEVTQEAHIGYKAVLWKIVTENGDTKKTQVNSSTYKAEPRYVTRGGAKTTPKPGKDPKASATPRATAAPKKTASPRSVQPEKTPKPTKRPVATKAPEPADPADATAVPVPPGGAAE